METDFKVYITLLNLDANNYSVFSTITMIPTEGALHI